MQGKVVSLYIVVNQLSFREDNKCLEDSSRQQHLQTVCSLTRYHSNRSSKRHQVSSKDPPQLWANRCPQIGTRKRRDLLSRSRLNLLSSTSRSRTSNNTKDLFHFSLALTSWCSLSNLSRSSNNSSTIRRVRPSKCSSNSSRLVVDNRLPNHTSSMVSTPNEWIYKVLK